MQLQSEVAPPTEKEFNLFQGMIHKTLGIYLPEQKTTLLYRRLCKRLYERGCSNFSQYYKLINICSESMERQLAMELVTTNETYFFRESKHFDFLQSCISKRSLGKEGAVDVWSAACSTGEEAYSAGMVLEESFSNRWKIFASDVNGQVLRTASKGIYPLESMARIPSVFQHKFCRVGNERYEGKMRISPVVRRNISFAHYNLVDSTCHNSKYDVVFLRNIMIYFDKDTQLFLINRIVSNIKPGGYLFLGHAESLQGHDVELSLVKPSIYQRPD